jgi:hypothetical protein
MHWIFDWAKGGIGRDVSDGTAINSFAHATGAAEEAFAFGYTTRSTIHTFGRFNG